MSSQQSVHFPIETTTRFGESLCPSRVETLKVRLRQRLASQARIKLPIGYKRLERDLGPTGGETSIRRDSVERLMEEDAQEGRPLLAAFAINARGSGLPAPWFFRKAQLLGRFAGEPEDVEAFAFHAKELHRCRAYYADDASIDPAGWNLRDDQRKETEHA